MSDEYAPSEIIDALPECVRVEEVYQYEIKLRANPITSYKEEPGGKVRIEMPYDGYESLPMKTYERLQERDALSRPLKGTLVWPVAGHIPHPFAEKRRRIVVSVSLHILRQRDGDSACIRRACQYPHGLRQ